MKHAPRTALEILFALWVATVFALFFRQFWGLFANRLNALWSLWS